MAVTCQSGALAAGTVQIMSAEPEAAAKGAHPSGQEPIALRRLLPPGEVLSIADVIGQLGLPEAGGEGGRPYVLLNMISTADGRATLRGRSGPLGNPADRALFHGLRSAVDAVMVGAGTLRAERYGRLIADPGTRSRRAERGQSAEPLACVVSGRLELPVETPLLASAEARVAIITNSEATLAGAAAHVEYVRAVRDGALDLPAAMVELRERFSVRTLLCEGGPHLNANLLADGLVDELFLALAPKVAGGDPASGEALRIVAGPPLPEPAELQLLGVLAEDSYLFARYGVRSSLPDRVARVTTSSSSLAS
jgi:riboflavin-specific deaminase-like protein